MFSTNDELIAYSKQNPSKLIVMDFNAAWCGPCKAVKPFLLYLKENYPNIDFIEIDIEDTNTASITEFFDISKVPTFIYFKNGKICHKVLGTNKDTIENAINDNI